MNEIIINETSKPINSTIESTWSEYSIDINPTPNACELTIYEATGITLVDGESFDPSLDYTITGDWTFSEPITAVDGLYSGGLIDTAEHGSSLDWYLSGIHSSIISGNPHQVTHLETVPDLIGESIEYGHVSNSEQYIYGEKNFEEVSFFNYGAEIAGLYVTSNAVIDCHLEATESVRINDNLTAGGLVEIGENKSLGASFAKLNVSTGDLNTALAGHLDVAEFVGSNKKLDGTNSIFNVLISSNDTAANDTGGTLGFGGRYLGTTFLTFAGIKGALEEAGGNYPGYLSFGTRKRSEEIKEHMRINSIGNLIIGSTSQSDDYAKLESRGCVKVTNVNNTGATLFSDLSGSNYITQDTDTGVGNTVFRTWDGVSYDEHTVLDPSGALGLGVAPYSQGPRIRAAHSKYAAVVEIENKQSGQTGLYIKTISDLALPLHLEDSNGHVFAIRNNGRVFFKGSANGLSFPTGSGINDQVLTTDGSGNLSWTDKSGGGLVTGITTLNGQSGATQTFTGTGVTISSIGDNHHFTSTYIELDTLDSVTDKGASTTNAISVGAITAPGGHSTQWNSAYGWGNHASAGYLTGTKVDSFNTRTGAVTLTSGDVTGALTYTPYNISNPANYTSNTGTVTSISTSGAITGGTINSSGTISHLTSAGYKHIPTGGSSSQILQYSASGTAVWYTPPWTTNTGTVTSVTAGTAMTQTGTSTINPTLNVDLGIGSAQAAYGNHVHTGVYDNYSLWSIASSSGGSRQITSGNTLTLTEGDGIDISVSVGSDNVTLDVDWSDAQPNDIIFPFTSVIVNSNSTYPWAIATLPNIFDSTIGSGTVTINAYGASNGMSGMFRFSTSSSATTLVLQNGGGTATAWVDSGADLVLETNTKYFLTYTNSNGIGIFNLAKYITQ